MATDSLNMGEPAEIASPEQEISNLKLQLNATQQEIARLELEIHQKEEVIIKTQAEKTRQCEVHKNEIKKLKEQLKETSKIIESNSTSELQEALKLCQEKEHKASTELNDHIQKEKKMNLILAEYETTIANNARDFKKLSELHEQVKGNLATLELAFHDVIQKYERSKKLIEEYKVNDLSYKENIDGLEKCLRIESQRYESLKAHALSQLERANKDNNKLKTHCDANDLKKNAIIKRLEIKVVALENSLEQKNNECAELAALCDEVTGKKV